MSRFTSGMCTLAALACATVGGIPFIASAQTNATPDQPRVLIQQTNHLTATVEAIDYAKREVTLRGPNGNSAQFAVSDAVRNFPQMKKGDLVRVSFYDSIALAVAKPGETLPATSRTQALATRQPGQRPGAAALSITDTTATVEDIDRENRTVTLKGVDGNEFKVVVDPSVGDLSRIKKGDQIAATRTEALAISVEAPESKSGESNSEQK